jgi:hypothetical protein
VGTSRRKLSRSSAAVATSREGHRSLTADRAGQAPTTGPGTVALATASRN